MKIWNEFLLWIEEKLGVETVKKWLKPLKVIKFDACNLYLDATDSFQIFWFEEHVRPYFIKACLDSRGSPFKLHFYLNGSPFNAKKKKEPIIEVKQYFSPDHLASHASFAEYIPGEAPELAFDILSQLSSLKPIAYNPIFLYGPRGSGKTHLLMAAAHKLKQEGKSVFFVHSETFAEHVIRAFRTSSLQNFRLTYRNIDCLIIDDIHILRGKAGTQEEFFHTFNRLHGQGVQILLSANIPPYQLEGIEDRLKSRFEWGITLPLFQPSPALKEKIVKKRAKALDIHLTEILTAYLLQTFQTLPAATRALEALALRGHYTDKQLDISRVEILLKDLIEEENKNLLTPEKIVTQVSCHFKMGKGEILSRSQTKECVLARKIAMYLCRKNLRMSYLKIGAFFSRDHSTVISSIKDVEKSMEKKDQAIIYPLQHLRKMNEV